MQQHSIKILVALLFLAGLVPAFFKIYNLGLPLQPDREVSVWVVEAKVEFDGRNKPVIVNFDIPDQHEDFVNLDESYISRNYGSRIEKHGKDRRVEWSIRRAHGHQQLYYRIDLGQISADSALIVPKIKKEKAPAIPKLPEYDEPFASAVSDLLTKSRSESADTFTFVSQLLAILNKANSSESVAVIRKGISLGSEAWVEQVIYVLAGARIPARMVRGILLEDGKTNVKLLPWLEIHNGEQWEGFDPLSGNKGYPKNFVRWATGSDPVLIVKGGKNSTLSFSLASHSRSAVAVAHNVADVSSSLLTSWSLFELPINTQNLYRILLTLPIGALVVVLARVFIGMSTLGTFMPILIAIAFRETELVWGVVLFCCVVGLGLTMRFYLETLQLLLIPRLSAVLVLVILSMLFISLASHKLNFNIGFSIALFPIVILTMVIERMSIVWAELGKQEAFKQCAGSLIVAIVSYLIMSNKLIEHLMFTFPELLFIVLALFILAGRYSGYRLTEVIRFSAIAHERAAKKAAPQENQHD